MCDAGHVLRYGPRHNEDRYGGLGQASLYDSDEDWSTFEITNTEFERASSIMPRAQGYAAARTGRACSPPPETGHLYRPKVFTLPGVPTSLL
jgi:hypothetical protein